MAYNFYSDMENWSKAKSEWDKANQAGDEKGKFNAHAKAQVYGDNLRKNGYTDIADAFSNSNYAQSQELLKKYESQKPKNYVYDPATSVANIHQSKGWYDEAIAKGDQAGADLIAAKAQAYYGDLINNGYNDLAYNLSNANYEGSKTIYNDYMTRGKTATRDYVNTLGKKYGLSADDMSKIITYDNRTGEVLIGGKKVGKPDVVIDGVSYWADDKLPMLESEFNNYISRTGTTRSKETAVNQENEDLFSKYRGAYDYAMNTNPFTTDEARAILGKYDLAGLNARDNAVASGGASNGGNIDSYAAANAMRQQASLVNQGQMAVLDAHNQKINNIRGILSDMGVNIDRVFNQDETTKTREFEQGETKRLNDAAILSQEAAVTGKVPVEWYLKNDPFLSSYVDENGKLKAEYKNTDFQNLINYAKTQGKTELANKYAILRGLKLSQYFDEFGHYAAEGDVAFIEPGETADVYLTKYQSDNALEMTKDTNASNVEMNKSDNEANVEIAKTNERINKYNVDAESNLQKYITDQNAKTAQYEIDAANKKLTEEQLESYKTSIQTVTELNSLLSSFGDGNNGPKNFVLEVLVPKYQQAAETFGMVGEEIVINLIQSNTNKYNIDKDEAKKICEQLKVDTSWLDKYEDCTSSDAITDKNGKTIEAGEYYGMKLKGTKWDQASQSFKK